MKKYGVLFFSVCLMLFLFTGTALAEEDPSVKGDWTGDGEDWQYMLPDGMYLEKSWLYHLRVNPPHWVRDLELLNERTISVPMGAYKNIRISAR